MESTQVHLRGDGVQVEGQHVKRENAENMIAEDREGTLHLFRILIYIQVVYAYDILTLP